MNATKLSDAETWRRVSGWPYEISNAGNIRRCIPAKGGTVGKVMKPSIRKNYLGDGYKIIGISSNGNKFTASIHRLVANEFIGPVDGFVIDHLNGDTLDNRPENLRICSQAVNSGNTQRIPKNNTSGYIGVSIDKRYNKKWRAHIRHMRKNYSLGMHETPEDAARAYDKKAIQLRGKHTFLNFPSEAIYEAMEGEG